MGNKNIDLAALAKSTMRERGFDPEFSAQIDAQVKALPSAEHFSEIHPSWKDYRHLLWTSIDNDDSKDLDQVEVAERLSEDVQRRDRTEVQEVRYRPAQAAFRCEG